MEISKLKDFKSLKGVSDSDIDELLLVFDELNSEQRHLIITKLISDNPINYQKILSARGNTDEDRVYLLRELLKTNNIYSYKLLNKISNTSVLSDYEIRSILGNADTLNIVKDFGTKFKSIIFERADYYKLLIMKKDLTVEDKLKIYTKSFSDYEQYVKVIQYLDLNEKMEYIKIFIDNNCMNDKIAENALINGFYYENNLLDLIKILENKDSARMYYNILMNTTLDDKSIDRLEKDLLKTKNIEYIAYYYFYRNINMFNKIFGSALLFLTFVQMNKHLFKDTIILDRITMDIKSKNERYNNSVNDNIEHISVKVLKKEN